MIWESVAFVVRSSISTSEGLGPWHYAGSYPGRQGSVAERTNGRHRTTTFRHFVIHAL
jgi:hypothetical protein